MRLGLHSARKTGEGRVLQGGWVLHELTESRRATFPDVETSAPASGERTGPANAAAPGDAPRGAEGARCRVRVWGNPGIPEGASRMPGHRHGTLSRHSQGWRRALLDQDHSIAF